MALGQPGKNSGFRDNFSNDAKHNAKHDAKSGDRDADILYGGRNDREDHYDAGERRDRRDRRDQGQQGQQGQERRGFGERRNDNRQAANPLHPLHPLHPVNQQITVELRHLSLARWLAEVGQSRAGLMGLYETPAFAELWYGARAAGERLRAETLERLYRNRPYPGGPHPDPREPAVFSSQAIITDAALSAGLAINPIPPAQSSKTASERRSGNSFNSFGNLPGNPSGAHSPSGSWQAPAVRQGSRQTDPNLSRHFDFDEETGQRLPYAWLATFPGERGPEITLRTMHASQQRMEHEIACLIGFWQREHKRLLDPDAPTGPIHLPRDPSIQTLLHQFAIGLLCLDKKCPPSWGCHCNSIRSRFNAPPPDHEAPTGAFDTLDTLNMLAHDELKQDIKGAAGDWGDVEGEVGEVGEVGNGDERRRHDSKPPSPYRADDHWIDPTNDDHDDHDDHEE